MRLDGLTAVCGGVAVYAAARGESKVNIMGGPTDDSNAIIAVGPPITGRVHCVGASQRNIQTSVKSRETDHRNDYENRSPVLATSDPLLVGLVILIVLSVPSACPIYYLSKK